MKRNEFNSSSKLILKQETLPYRRPSPRAPQPTMSGSAGTSPRGRAMDRGHMEPSLSVEEDRASVNSFKTCPSETNLSYTPRQVSDTYGATLPAAARKESTNSRKESATAPRTRKDSAGSSTTTTRTASAEGAKNSPPSSASGPSSLSPKTSILRSNAYAAEPRRTTSPSGLAAPSAEGQPPRSPSGVPLPQLVERPPSQNEFSYGSLMQQGPGNV